MPIIALGALFASCSGSGDDSASAAAAGGGPQQAFRVRSGEMFDDDSDKILGRYGSSNPQYGSGGNAATESGRQEIKEFEGEFGRREFSTTVRDRPAFWGSKEYPKAVYGGDLDGSGFQKAAKLADKGAHEGTQISRENGRSYRTGAVESRAASEAGRGERSRPSDAETDVRRRVYQQPDVEDWRPQRALTVEDTKGMLGR